MSLLAEIYLAADDLVLIPTIRTGQFVRIDFERGSVIDPEDPPLLIWVTADDFDAFERVLAADETVIDTTLLDEIGNRRLYRMAHAETTNTLYPIYAELGGALLAAHAVDDGWEMQMRFPDRDALVAFHTACRERGISFRLDRLYQSSDRGTDGFGLTDSQRETLVKAFEMGYFHVPRNVSQGELADALGISKSALSQRLRRGIEELIEHTLITSDGRMQSFDSESGV